MLIHISLGKAPYDLKVFETSYGSATLHISTSYAKAPAIALASAIGAAELHIIMVINHVVHH